MRCESIDEKAVDFGNWIGEKKPIVTQPSCRELIDEKAVDFGHWIQESET